MFQCCVQEEGGEEEEKEEEEEEEESGDGTRKAKKAKQAGAAPPKKARVITCMHGCGKPFRRDDTALKHEQKGTCLASAAAKKERERLAAEKLRGLLKAHQHAGGRGAWGCVYARNFKCSCAGGRDRLGMHRHIYIEDAPK